MYSKRIRSIFNKVSALLLSICLACSVGVSPALAAGITVAVNQSPSSPLQRDPTNTSPIYFKAIFSEAVTGFDASDISFAGSTNPGALSATIAGSGARYLITVTGMASGDTVIVSIPAEAASGAGGTSEASTSTDNSVTYDTTVPTVTLNQKIGQLDPTNASPILYSAVFSEPVTGFDGNDITFTGTAPGTKVAVVTQTGPTTYDVSVTGMTGSGTVIASVRANAALDLAGNWSPSGTGVDRTVSYDVTAPTVTINQSAASPVQSDPANTSPIIFKAIFSESVTGFTASDVSFTGSTNPGALSATVTGSGAGYAVQVTGMASGDTVVASIPAANAAQDLAGNASAAGTSTDNSVTYITSVPTVTINQSLGQPDPAASAPISFTAVFSAAVTGFNAADVAVSGSAPGVKVVNVAGGPTTYTVTVSGMTGRGSVAVSVRTNAAQDGAGNWSLASTSTDNSVDYRSPLVVDTAVDKDDGVCVQGNCSLREAVNASFPGDAITFSLAYPATITLSSRIDINRDITISGPGASNLTVQGAGSNRVFDGHEGHTITISGMTIANGSSAAQGAGINSLGTLTLNNVVLSDNTAPSGGAIYNQGTLTITNSTLAGNHAASGAAIYNTGTLSITNSTLGNNSATGQAGGIYNAATGTVTLLHASIVDNPGGGVYNAGTLNYTSTVIAKNGVAGDCTLAGAGSLGTNLTNFVGTATCSASLSGDPLLDGLGSKSTESLDTFAPYSGSPLLDAANPGTCPATDERGVARPIGAGCDIGAFEGNRPSVTVNQAGGQADPTAVGPILFTVVFGDPITGFDVSDVVLSGTAAGTLTPVLSEVAPNDGTTYQISVTGMTGTGTVIATVSGGAVVNAQGNASGTATSTDRTVAYDVTAPTVAIDQSPTGPVQLDPTNTSSIIFKAVFSESVTGFDASDISFDGSTNPGALSATVTAGSASRYAVQITGMASGDTVVVSIPVSAAQDLAGNTSAASTSTDNQVTYDATAPGVTINQAGTQTDPASSQPVVFTVVFSEAVTGFDAADLLLSGTAGGTRVITVVMIDASTYRVEVTGLTTGGTVIASVRPGAALDAALNLSSASTSTDNTVTFTP